ncbi:fibronectin type III domain-containing protein [Candidatus Peregrinibacteria bacterium]|nr:fibronectin type III domain-containing protein [Candidatus Peregrinibacteria bacterium]
MKKILFAIALACLLQTPFARADLSQRVVLEEVVGRRNVVIHDPQTDEKVFLHLRIGCGELTQNQSATVVIQGTLNGNSDFLKIDSTRQCAIDQVEPFTQKLYIRQFTLGNSEILVSDESGQEYLLQYGTLCSAMAQFRESWIFVRQNDQTLAQSDRLFLPDRSGECPVDRIEKRAPSTPTKPTDKTDRQLPTAPSGLKPALGNGEIHLTWRAATDDRGISHYLVSHSPNAIDPKGIATQDMPNLTQSKSTRFTVTGLENGQRTYFYVAAVDTSGNRSSDWATAQATPSSAIPATDANATLNLRMGEETDQSFWVRWDRIPGATRYWVTLEADHKRLFSNARFPEKTLQVRKGQDRQGKTLTVTVRALGYYGLMKEETIEFGF